MEGEEDGRREGEEGRLLCFGTAKGLTLGDAGTDRDPGFDHVPIRPTFRLAYS